MKFMLLITSAEGSEAKLSAAEREAMLAGHMKFGAEAGAAGKMVGGERLRPESEATRLRLKGSQRQVVDGPFAETKEGLGGFYILECADKAEAIEWAWKLPHREGMSVEVRPIWPM